MRISKQNLLPLGINFALGFFFISILAIKGGYNISPFILIFLGLGYFLYGLKQKWQWSLSSQDKLFIYSYLLYFLLFVLSLLFNGGKGRELDNPSRVLLLIPVLLLLLRIPFNLKIIMVAIPCGAITAGLVAVFDKLVLHSPEAYAPRMMHIQAGDIAMSLGMFSLLLALYAQRKQLKIPTLFCLASALMGMLGSFLSTARGGWIGLPIILGLMLWIYRQSLSRGFFIGLIGIFVLGGAALSQMPQNRISERFTSAQVEIERYWQHQDGSTSVGARFDMWKSALLMAQQKPILGWGIQGAAEERKKMAEQGIISTYAGQFGHAHNQYLDDLSKRGVLGLFTLLAIFFIPLRAFWQHTQNPNQEVKLCAALGVVHVISTMCYCLSQGFFAHNSGNIFYFFLTVVFYAALKNQLQVSHENSRHS